MRRKPHEVRVVIEPVDGGGLIAHVTNQPACIIEGDTREPTLPNVRKGIELYLGREGEI